MTRIHFTPEMQDEIYNQVFGKDRRWLSDAVAYTHRTRRAYPADDPRWTEQTSIDHILYYITAARAMERDATLDDRNIIVKLRRWLDNNPCILPEMPTSFETDIVGPNHGLDLEAEMNAAMAAHVVSETDAAIIAEKLEEMPPEPPAPSPEPPVTPEVTKAVKKKATKKKASKKKASKKKATKKKVSKKKSTKKKVSKKK